MPKQPRTLQCFLCHVQFGNKVSNLRRHIRLHGPFVTLTKCPECGKSYQNKENYKSHWIAKHTGTPKPPHSMPAHSKKFRSVRSFIPNIKSAKETKFDNQLHRVDRGIDVKRGVITTSAISEEFFVHRTLDNVSSKPTDSEMHFNIRKMINLPEPQKDMTMLEAVGLLPKKQYGKKRTIQSKCEQLSVDFDRKGFGQMNWESNDL